MEARVSKHRTVRVVNPAIANKDTVADPSVPAVHVSQKPPIFDIFYHRVAAYPQSNRCHEQNQRQDGCDGEKAPGHANILPDQSETFRCFPLSPTWRRPPNADPPLSRRYQPWRRFVKSIIPRLRMCSDRMRP